MEQTRATSMPSAATRSDRLLATVMRDMLAMERAV